MSILVAIHTRLQLYTTPRVRTLNNVIYCFIYSTLNNVIYCFIYNALFKSLASTLEPLIVISLYCYKTITNRHTHWLAIIIHLEVAKGARLISYSIWVCNILDIVTLLELDVCFLRYVFHYHIPSNYYHFPIP